jgi:DNA-binding CsgD family transcriptional regulator/tetratricopeptide (TPR) repeat protein
LLTRLDPRLPLLTDGPRDQPDRLRTMHDAIAWSHDLLIEEERQLFRRLAVFVGGCTMAAAEWVSSAGDRGLGLSTADHPRDTRLRISDTLDHVQRLVDQAVLQRQIDGAGEPRFAMLETIREYGLARLVESGEEAATRDAHAAWCVAFAELAGPELAGPDQAIWVRRLETELGNIRAAHDWLHARGDAESALRLAGAIGWFWSSTPYLEEARGRFDALLAMPGIEQFPAALAKVLNSAGDIADWQGDQIRARAHYERALSLYRELGDRWEMAGILRGLGSSAIDRGELDLAITLLEECRALAREVGNTWEMAAAANLIGTALSVRGEYAAAMSKHEEAVRAWRELGDDGHVTTALASVAWVALRAQEWRRAAEAYRETLDLAAAGGDEWYVAWATIGGGGLAAARGDAKVAAELLGAGLAHRERLGALLRPHVQQATDETITTVREHLGEREFAAHWHAGRGLPLDAAARQAAAVLDAVLQERADPYGLTRRERDVLRLLAEGMADKEIAGSLFVARATASKHVAAILEKLGVESRTAAVAVALRHDLV